MLNRGPLLLGSMRAFRGPVLSWEYLLVGKFMTTTIHVSRSPYRKSGILYVVRNEFNFQTEVKASLLPQLIYKIVLVSCLLS